MDIIKTIHIICAVLTIITFTVRGIWMLQGSPLLNTATTRIVPHIIDAILLFSGLVLLVAYYRDFYYFDWLILKISAIILHIISGSIALKYGKTLFVRFSALLVSWGLLSLIVFLAVTRPYSIF